jgi:hypothetical protein
MSLQKKFGFWVVIIKHWLKTISLRCYRELFMNGQGDSTYDLGHLA